ncbi:uncharacterized protein B0I36DRAFT_320950 [Microdochium trichocladiopsis]|uniref:Uncharacterized protein n=1 Tax=Microdochium trichocladiopsis TaxID=1682393 RepID=A0A9P8Y6T3_9PEZI|nr:uncharacterized protein B0I36DRAFT_320950 [Microdochium trichocladiopsis]KAH7033195.1 hypothetical protein B0I36DRAFT_320950 [Microdochium trichocladiopsis]
MDPRAGWRGRRVLCVWTLASSNTLPGTSTTVRQLDKGIMYFPAGIAPFWIKWKNLACMMMMMMVVVVEEANLDRSRFNWAALHFGTIVSRVNWMPGVQFSRHTDNATISQ